MASRRYSWWKSPWSPDERWNSTMFMPATTGRTSAEQARGPLLPWMFSLILQHPRSAARQQI